MITIVSTRFNQDTWYENKKYREKNKFECIYGSPVEMTTKICMNSTIFVIEMNNTKNEIEGIGLLKNKTFVDKYYCIYRNGDYNRYIYIGKYYLDRDKLISINIELIKVIEYILFKEKTHLKRGYGFTMITEKIMKKNKNKDINIKKDLSKCFIQHFTPLKK
jgi:hypothetical protein